MYFADEQRCHFGYIIEDASEAAEKVARIMQKEYSWDDETKNNEIQTYLDYVKKSVSFIL